ncbi:MAG: 5' nucleotidase, NT5C type [Alphaproteobacteria bacterium]
MLVALDIDGVVADFLPPFLQRLAEYAGNGPIDPQSVTDPSFSNHPFLSQEIISRCVTEVSYDAGFWQELAPLPSPAEWLALDRLSRDNRLIFITHRYERDTYDIARITGDWLRQHGISNPIVYFTQSHKSELIEKLAVELFVDDRHENCREAAENTRAVVMMPHRPYNSAFNHPRVQRIHDLMEIFSFLSGTTRSIAGRY